MVLVLTENPKLHYLGLRKTRKECSASVICSAGRKEPEDARGDKVETAGEDCWPSAAVSKDVDKMHGQSRPVMHTPLLGVSLS